MALTHLTVNAGPMDPNWQDRLREELLALLTLVESNAEKDNDWFSIEPIDDDGIQWNGTCWYLYESKRYTFKVQFEIPATYPSTPIEIELPELDGLTAKMYRGVEMIHRIGLIADVQYADVDDVWNFMKTHKRRYRATLVALRNAVNWWNENEVDFVADLGDAIDGCKNLNRTMAMHALNLVQQEWTKLKSSVLHLVGNHELYLFTRSELCSGIPCGKDYDFSCVCPSNVPGSPRSTMYYSFKLPEPSPWRVVVLDAYEVSTISNGANTVHAESFKFCQENNPNDIGHSTNFFKDLQGTQCRWSPFNGGLGKGQLLWLEQLLKEASNEQLIVFSHVILHPEATPNGNCHTLLWNYEAVKNLFAKYPGRVRLVICGHAHQPGYFLDPTTNIHHITLASPLEAAELAEDTFAILELSVNSATLIGKGGVKSLELF